MNASISFENSGCGVHILTGSADWHEVAACYVKSSATNSSQFDKILYCKREILNPGVQFFM